jgi:hypothetical protein
MRVQLELMNGDFREVELPQFSTMTVAEQFQQFLQHFKVAGSMIDTNGHGIPFHAVLEAVLKGNQDGQTNVATEFESVA